MYFSGDRFAPGNYLNTSFDGPAEDFDFPGEGNRLLLVQDDGTFGPWDVTFVQPDEVGAWTVRFTDGTCEAAVTFSVTEPR